MKWEENKHFLTKRAHLEKKSFNLRALINGQRFVDILMNLEFAKHLYYNLNQCFLQESRFDWLSTYSPLPKIIFRYYFPSAYDYIDDQFYHDGEILDFSESHLVASKHMAQIRTYFPETWLWHDLKNNRLIKTINLYFWISFTVICMLLYLAHRTFWGTLNLLHWLTFNKTRKLYILSAPCSFPPNL